MNKSDQSINIYILQAIIIPLLVTSTIFPQCTGCNEEFYDCEFGLLENYDDCYVGDVQVLQEILNLNDAEDVPLMEFGRQIWEDGRINYFKANSAATGFPLYTLPTNIGDLTFMEELRLTNNQLTVLPYSITNLNHLKIFHASHNLLLSIPETIGSINNPNLYWVSFSNNSLSSLPESIGELSYMYKLSLQENNLTELPESIGNMEELGVLDIGYNNLFELPSTITELENLIRIYAEGNNLSFLPDSFGNLTNLMSADFSFNLLQEIPYSIGELNNVTFFLNFSNNLLVDLPESICDIEPGLENLAVGLGENYLCPDSNIPVCDEGSLIILITENQNCGWYLPGDTSLDGFVDVLDIIMCVSIILQTNNLTHFQEHNADANLDNTVDVLDILIIVNYIMEQ